MATESGIEIFTALQDLVHPQRTALLVYDMQVGVVPQIKEGAGILSEGAQSPAS